MNTNRCECPYGKYQYQESRLMIYCILSYFFKLLAGHGFCDVNVGTNKIIMYLLQKASQCECLNVCDSSEPTVRTKQVTVFLFKQAKTIKTVFRTHRWLRVVKSKPFIRKIAKVFHYIQVPFFGARCSKFIRITT